MTEKLELKTGYCPICDRVVRVLTNVSATKCSICGHHISLHREETKDVQE